MAEDKEKNSYLKFISYLQVIGIILVVAGHSLHEYPDGYHGYNTIVSGMIYSFHMPLFIFISGFLFIYTSKSLRNKSVKDFVYNKFCRLIIPYITLTLVTFIPKSLMNGMADDPIEFNFLSFIKSFFFNDFMPIPFLWYIQTLFFLLMFVYGIIYIADKYKISTKFIITSLLIIFSIFYFLPVGCTTFFSLDKTKEFGIFFIIGNLYALYYEKIEKFADKNLSGKFLLVTILWIVSFNYIENYKPVELICSILGIIMCILLSKIIEKKHIHIFDHLIGANYIIFLLSWYCNVICQQVLSHFVVLPWYIHSALSLLSGIYIPWLGYKYLEKHQDSNWIKFTSFILGQSFKKKKTA